MTIGSNPPCDTYVRTYGKGAVAEAAALILDGWPVAIPTETVYGLAADSTNAEAVARIYTAKGRPSFNPLIVHVTDRAMAEQLAVFDAIADKLVQAFWPGPLTLVLPQVGSSPVASIATAGLDTIAIRCPAHPAMRDVIAATGKPLAAPSANASGKISPTTADHGLASLAGRIPMILDAGPCERGLESTIVAVRTGTITLLRPGPVTAAMLEEATGLTVRHNESKTINAPGQLESHYAPETPVLLGVSGKDKDSFLIGFGEMESDYNLSENGDLTEAAARLFDALHVADASGAKEIHIAPIPEEDLGVAINDRLRRAAV